MKGILALAFALGFCSLAGAKEEVEFPKDTHVLAQLEKAKAEAAATKKPIAFIIADEASTTGREIRATNEFLDVLKSKAVIVYASVDQAEKDEQPHLPPMVYDAATKVTRQRLPIVILTDEAVSKELAAFAYGMHRKRETIDLDETVRFLKKKLRDLAEQQKEKKP
jgi:hypothetical protein